MLKGKSLLVYRNLFSPNYYEKNDKIILKYFPYDLYILKIALILSVVYSKCGHEFKKILKKKNQLKHQQFLV